MSGKPTYYYPDGSVTFDNTLIVTGAGTPSRIEQLERENAALRSLLQDSLEWLDDYGMRMSGTINLVNRIETALRKETTP